MEAPVTPAIALTPLVRLERNINAQFRRKIPGQSSKSDLRLGSVFRKIAPIHYDACVSSVNLFHKVDFLRISEIELVVEHQ